MMRGGKKLRVFGVGHLASAQFKGIHPNTMHRPLVILAHIAAHQEPALCNLNHPRGCKMLASILADLISFVRLHVVSG